ncbi:MAG: MmcQ/YjbR family DNA-binding protein [Candidatus Dormibacter sp.]
MVARKRVSADLLAHALTMPEAWRDTPWADDCVVKVGKKVFAFFGSPAHPPRLGIKLPRSTSFALRCGSVTPSGYGLGRSGWVTVSLDSDDIPERELLRDWIVESYCTIAPKRLSKLLDSATR